MKQPCHGRISNRNQHEELFYWIGYEKENLNEKEEGKNINGECNTNLPSHGWNIINY